MPRLIFCQKLQKEAPGLERAPWPGELGEKIYNNISKDAWQMWLKHQTMLINEYKLSALDLKDRQFLAKEMEKFLFSDGAQKPAGFVPME